MSSVVLLYMILIEGVFGTFSGGSKYFPPVSDLPPPPIPSQTVRTQRYYVQENLPQDFQPPQEGLFSSEEKVNDQRWYLQENPPDEGNQAQRSTESFDRFFQSGEPAIGPVATPIPDDAYLSPPSNLPNLNPNEPVNSDVWILTRRPENQYIPDRWVQVQLPAERIVEVVNQDPAPPLATDTVKSVVGPVSSEVPVKTQFTANTLANIIQQVWVRSPNRFGSQIFGNPSAYVDDVPSVKQVVDIPTTNGKQSVQQQVIKDGTQVPPPDSAPAPLLGQKSFTVPPPPPPPLKGYNAASKSGPPSPLNAIPDSNVLYGDNGLFQRVRHIWVPTSPRTGKFISFPVSTSVSSGKSIINAGISLDSTPVRVSDTWVLRQDGLVPSFEQRKSILPPPEIQSGNVIIQDPPVINVDAPPNPPVVDLLKNPIIAKSVDSPPPVDIWPARQEKISSKSISKYSGVNPELFPASPITDDIAVTKSLPPLPQKSLSKSLVPPPIPPPTVNVVSDKPCPLPLPPRQKFFLSPRGPSLVAIPRFIAPQKRPLARIVRVNRYPSGSYYLLNNRIRPSFFTYPNAGLLQSKAQFVRLVQSNQVPPPLQSKPLAVPLRIKQIPIPPQLKNYPAPVPARQVIFPFRGRQIVAPVPPPKSSRIIYPAQQAMKYTYPWNAKYNPAPGRGVYNLIPQTAPLPISSLDSSSESSSESSSSESEEKEKVKAEKPKKEESTGSAERERESSPEETEPDSKEASAEAKSAEESIEAAESQVSHALTEPHVFIANLQENPDTETAPEPHSHKPTDTEAFSEDTNEPVTHDNVHLNTISNTVTNSETHPAVEGSTDAMATA